MSETTPGETPVERRLRELHNSDGWLSRDYEVMALGCEAIALLREIETVTFEQWEARRRALLARCEGDR